MGAKSELRVHIKLCEWFIVRVAKMDEPSKLLTFCFRTYF